MGINDRPYMYEEGGGASGPLRGVGVGMPKPGRIVKILLLINVVVFFFQLFLDRYLVTVGAVTVGTWWHPWRYVTFQFLHGGFWHIALNMLGLYLLGTPLEQRFGPRKFLWFYLSCGVVAGVAYVIIGTLFGLPDDLPIVGASGGVYGVVLACAVFFPQFRLIFLFFPVPIRLACIIIFGGMVMLVMQTLAAGQIHRAMSDVAHLGGVAAAAAWIWLLPRVQLQRQMSLREANRGAWERKRRREREQEEEIDRILDKIRREGIASLTRKERQTLQDASRRGI